MLLVSDSHLSQSFLWKLSNLENKCAAHRSHREDGGSQESYFQTPRLFLISERCRCFFCKQVWGEFYSWLVLHWVTSPSNKTCWNCNSSASECDLIQDKSLSKCNWVKMKSLRCVLIQYNGYPYQKWKFGHRDRYKEETLCEDTQGDCHMTMKAELGVMKLWVNECQRLLAIHRKLEEAKKDSFRFQRHHGPTDTLFQMSSLQNCESLSYCLLIYLFVFVWNCCC